MVLEKREKKELVVLRGKLDPLGLQVHGVSAAVMVHQVLQDCVELMEHWELLENLVVLENLDHLDFLEPQEQREIWVQLVLKVALVFRDLEEKLENQGTQEKQEEWDHRVKMEAMEIKEVWDHLVLLDLLDFQGQEVNLDLMEVQVPQELKAWGVHLDLPE